MQKQTSKQISFTKTWLMYKSANHSKPIRVRMRATNGYPTSHGDKPATTQLTNWMFLCSLDHHRPCVDCVRGRFYMFPIVSNWIEQLFVWMCLCARESTQYCHYRRACNQYQLISVYIDSKRIWSSVRASFFCCALQKKARRTESRGDRFCRFFFHFSAANYYSKVWIKCGIPPQFLFSSSEEQ